MAILDTTRHRFEFQPEPALIDPGPRRGWITRLSTADSHAHATVPRLVSIPIWLAAAAAALALGITYVLERGSAPLVDGHQFARLAVASLIGTVVTAVHRRVKGDRPHASSLERAQILLCLAGALTMILIDNSIARAFGVAGAASIVRFRTPVEDPTDATVLFLLMGLGMASGVGALGVSIIGAAGVCVLLVAFRTLMPEPRGRAVTIELIAAGREFPAAHVRSVFAKYGITSEPCEWMQDDATRVKYRTWVDAGLSLEALGGDLMNGGASGLASVTWELRKSAA